MGRVLLATADEQLATRLRRELQRTRITAVWWVPGAAAPPVAPSGSYHVVVLDADGGVAVVDAVLAAARSVSPGVITIALANNPPRGLVLRLLRAGVQDFREKPVEVFELASAVREACHRSIISKFSAEMFGRLRNSESRLDRNQIELYDAVVHSNEELQNVNRRLHRVVSQLKTLYHMGRDLAENENWSDALDRSLMALVNFLDANGASLLLFSRNGSVLAPRANFQIDGDVLAGACARILGNWKEHTRSVEIHSLEIYGEGKYKSCLEGPSPWRMTVIPLRYRNRPLGFLLLDKEYADGFDFKNDYDFLNTLQTIFVEEIANASYISELRHLSRFNNKVLDNIRSGVITTDLDGTVNYSNEWARGMCPSLRTPRAKPAPSVHFNDLFQSRQFGRDFYQHVMSSSKSAHVLEVDCRGAGPECFPARLRTTKMYDDNLGGVVLVAIFEDLTEPKRMEAEIRRNDRLRVLGQVSAGVAHEIRNPLTGIATSVEVLAGKLGQDESRVKYIRVIMDEINRLDGIIRDLLDFARPPRPKIGPCSLPEIIGRAVSLLSEDAAKKGVKLDVVPAADAVHCEADAGQLTQVILNVVLNAIQACGEGDEIRLELGREEPADLGYARVVRIDVVDSGPGVPAHIRKSLFDPFVTTKSRGTGLGLAISQHIVEEHHGTIECEFLERGTRFSIRLPQHEPAELENRTKT